MRSERRHHEARVKAKTKRQLVRWRPIDVPASEREVGRQAATHCTCSCWMCGNPRRYGSNPIAEQSDDALFRRLGLE